MRKIMISKGSWEDFYYFGDDELIAKVYLSSDEHRLLLRMEALFLEYQAMLRSKVQSSSGKVKT